MSIICCEPSPLMNHETMVGPSKKTTADTETQKMRESLSLIHIWMALDAVITQGGSERCYTAINDVVVTGGTVSRLLDLDIWCGEEQVINYRADGVIVSTPTGSTAYAFSAGGPVIDPAIDTLEMTPICPHSLFSRPILFSPESTLAIRQGARNQNDVYVTIDGEHSVKIGGGDQIFIRQADKKVKFVLLDRSGFFKVIKAKFIERGD